MDVPAQFTVRQIRRLPADEREVILQTAAALAEQEYRTNRELTAFEAFGEKDMPAYDFTTTSAP